MKTVKLGPCDDPAWATSHKLSCPMMSFLWNEVVWGEGCSLTSCAGMARHTQASVRPWDALPEAKQHENGSRCKWWVWFAYTGQMMWWSICFARLLWQWCGWSLKRCIWWSHSPTLSFSRSSSISCGWVRDRAYQSILTTPRRSSLIFLVLVRILRRRSGCWSCFRRFLLYLSLWWLFFL